MSLLSGSTIAVVDTETTGFSPAEGHALVEVAWVPVIDGVVREVAAWSSLVDPGRPIPPEATRVHRITDAMVGGAPRPDAVARRLREACADLPLCFHNAPFDLPFLAALMRAGAQPPLTGPVIDTLGMARALPGSGGNGLGVLAQRFGLPPATAHRALGDALTTARLLVKLVAAWEGRARSLDELAAASQESTRARPGAFAR
jgi:DNA polymerase III epsilon subunit-like protein